MTSRSAIDAAFLEAASARLCELSFYDFVEQAWHIVEPGTRFISGWHVLAICDHLQACAEGKIRRLLINIPPRCMKSLLVCVFWPAWVWISRPETRWLFSAYAQHLSVRDSRRCRDIIQSPWYQRRWGRRFGLRSDQNQKVRFDNDHAGFRLASSTEGVGTGEGGDFIIADDPHNVIAGESDAERENALHWWGQSMSTRGNNPRTVCHVVVMQRLHERDLAGYLLEQGGYEHLCLPMEFDRDRRCTTSLGWSDPRTEQGELLCPDRFGAPDVAELKRRLGSYGTAGQLQQRPAPAGGGMFKRPWFQIVGAKPGGWVSRARYWDLAAAPEGSYTCGVRMGKRDDGLFFVEDVLRGRWSPAERDKVILQTAALDGYTVRVVLEQEPGSAGKSVTDWLTRKLAGYPVSVDRPTGSKEVRAQPFAAQCEAGNVRLVMGPWIEAYLDELTVFPYAAYDDQVDASAGAFSLLARIPTEFQPPTFIAMPRRDPATWGDLVDRGGLRRFF